MLDDKALIIADVHILQDAHGRYSLNTLHRASGGRENKKPSNWVDLVGTKELIEELNTQRQDLTFDVVKGGNAPGIYAHELLAISYAGWVSPAFQLKVNQAFLTLRDLQYSLPSPRAPRLCELPIAEQIAGMQCALDFLADLGVLDERDKLMFGDLVRTSVQGQYSQGTGEQKLLSAPQGFFLADRVRTLGYALTRKQEASLMSQGLALAVSKEYRKQHGEKPTQSQRFVDGAVRPVFWYKEDNADWIDPLIQTWCARVGIAS